MEGGRFISAGSYSCIFTPPLLCKNGFKKDSSMIGKVTSIDEMKQELEIGKRVRSFPLAKNYFVVAEPESCELLSAEKQKDPGVQNCLESNPDFQAYKDTMGEMFPPSKVRQIFQPYGGDKQVHEYVQNIKSGRIQVSSANYFKIIEHLLEAGSVLLLIRMCHYDLHPANLLVDKKNVIRIIDFGLSFNGDNITEETIHKRTKPLLFRAENAEGGVHESVLNMEPPELALTSVKELDIPMNEAIPRLVKGRTIFRMMETYLGRSLNTSAQELQSFVKTSKSFRTGDNVGLWKTYWPGFDAWAIGCICLDFLTSFLYNKNFIEGPYRQQKPFIVNAIRGLLHPNPKKRLDCFEALAVLNPNSAFVERFGHEWLEARKKQRAN